MTTLLKRFVGTLTSVGLVSILPTLVAAQCPSYIAEWGSDGQFSEPFRIVAAKFRASPSR